MLRQQSWIASIAEAIVTAWRQDYSTVRPHSSPGIPHPIGVG